MNIYLKDHAEKLYIMSQRSARLSRCRVHIWHGCMMLFIKILAFDQNVGNANRCTSVDTTTPANVANVHITRVSGSEP